jgi:glutathione S-transferase
VALYGLESKFVREALDYHLKLLKTMDQALARGPWLAGEQFSLADAAVIPYILRLDLLKLEKLFSEKTRSWYARMRERPSVKKEMLDRMTPQDKAPFEALQPDPWPVIQKLKEEIA